jgi:hypothetical protein
VIAAADPAMPIENIATDKKASMEMPDVVELLMAYLSRVRNGV